MNRTLSTLLSVFALFAFACGGPSADETTTPTDETYTTTSGDEAYDDPPAPDYGDPDMEDGY